MLQINYSCMSFEVSSWDQRVVWEGIFWESKDGWKVPQAMASWAELRMTTGYMTTEEWGKVLSLTHHEIRDDRNAMCFYYLFYVFISYFILFIFLLWSWNQSLVTFCSFLWDIFRINDSLYWSQLKYMYKEPICWISVTKILLRCIIIG